MSSATPASARPASPDRDLRRALGLGALVSIGIGGIIGSGWLFGVLRAASIAGPAAIVSWVIGGVLSLVLALSWARMSETLPQSGATVRYVFYSHGSLAGFLLGWVRVLAVVTIPAIEAEAAVTALQVVLGRTHVALTLTSTGVFAGEPITTLDPAGVALALALLLAFFALNYRGIELLGRATVLATVWKLVVPSVTIVALLVVAEGSNFTAAAGNGTGGFAPYGWPSVFFAIATSGVMFAYLGFAQVVDYGGEARRPRRDLPAAILISTALATTIYVLLQVAFIGAVRWSSAGVPVGRWDLLAGSAWGSLPLYFALTAGVGVPFVVLGYVLLTDAEVSPAQTGWIYLGTGARALYGLSVEGYLPPILHRLHRTHRVPWVALAASLALGALFILPLPSWYELVGFISGALVISYVGAPVALPVFARHLPDRVRGSSTAVPTLLALSGFVVVAVILYWSGFTILTWLLVTTLAGLTVFLAYGAPRHLGVAPRQARAAALALGPALAALTVLGPAYGSWTGSAAATPLWSSTSASADSAYLVLLGAWCVAAIAFLYRRSDPRARREVVGGLWLVAWLYGTYLLSYVGEFGPVRPGVGAASAFPGARLLVFPLGTALVIAFAVGVFVVMVWTGFGTPALRAVADEADGSGRPLGR